MNLSSKLTVLILTYNRYDRLLRLLKYIDSRRPSFPMYLLDSSSNNYDASLFGPLLAKNNILHCRYPSSIQPLQKIHEGLKQVTTPYAVIWADDDFMVPRAFEAGVEFLERNNDFCFVHGQSGIFLADKVNGSLPLNAFSYYAQRDIAYATASARLWDHLNHYTCVFYSLYRTPILKKAMKMCVDYPFGYNFDEIVPSCLAVIHGKGKKLNQLYMLRERHEKAGIDWMKTLGGKSDFFDWVASPLFAKDYEKMRQILSENISLVDGIPMEEAGEVVDKAFWKYIADGMRHKWKSTFLPELKIRRRLRQMKVLHDFWMYFRSLGFRQQDHFLLSAFKRKRSPYYLDFEAIYRWIREEG